MFSSTVKSIVRHTIPEAHYHYLGWHRSRFGSASAIRSYLRLLTSRERLCSVSVPGSSHGVYVRPGTTDQDVFDQVFARKEYELDLGDPKFILDGGAHIGLASVFFALRYPRATVVSVEADPSNFELLVRNVGAFKNVRPIHAALWSHRTTLQIENPEGATWSPQVAEASGGGVPAITIDDVLSDFKLDHIDILKLDIEGAEQEVLSACHSWINRVDSMVVELHDRFRPGCSEALEQATRTIPYARSESGENVILRRIGS